MNLNSTSTGSLYLIPTTLGDTEPLEVLPLSVKKIIEQTVFFIVENEKTARRFIKKICPKKAQGKLKIEILNKFTDFSQLPTFLNPCLEGQNIGIISEAGCPAIADPGADIVSIAHEKGIEVVPLIGPSSILLSLMASGFNGQNFAFNGYLPIEPKERYTAIKRLERLVYEKNQTQLFIETPYRNDSLFEGLCKALQGQTKLCIACNITLPEAFIKTQTIAQWKKSIPKLHKKPCIFLFGKQ